LVNKKTEDYLHDRRSKVDGKIRPCLWINNYCLLVEKGIEEIISEDHTTARLSVSKLVF
jgi:hypothetical protein